MKGYCKCGTVIDEVEFTQFGMCEDCRLKESFKLIKKEKVNFNEV